MFLLAVRLLSLYNHHHHHRHHHQHICVLATPVAHKLIP